MPGRHLVSLGAQQSLWLAPDHLLLVSRSRFVETYNRFYYGDIQALVIVRNDRWKAWLLPLGPLAAVAVIAAAASEGGGRIAWGIAAAALILLVAVNVLLGPSCVTHLRTAVQTVELLSLRRLRTAQRAADLLRKAIEGVQGRVPPEILAELRSEPPGFNPPAPDFPLPVAPPPLPSAAGNPEAAVRDPGNIHAALFALLLADGALSALMFRDHRPWMSLIGFLLTIGVVACSVAALIRQRGSDVDRNLRSAVWGAVAYWGIEVLFGYAFLISFSLAQPDRVNNHWEYIRYVASLSPFDSPLSFASAVSALALAVPVGVYGFLLLARRRKGRRSPLVSAVAPRA